MVPETSPLLRRTTFVLMAIVYAAVEVASDPDGRPSSFGICFGIVAFLVAALVSYLVPVPTRTVRLPIFVTLCLALLLVAPVLIEPLIRYLTDNGLPLELQMVNGLRILGVGLTALAIWPLCLRLAGVVSLFLILFVAAMGDQKPIPWFLAAYAVVGSLWLMLAYSSRLQASMQATVTTPTAQPTACLRLRFPWWEMSVLLIVLGGALSLTVIGPKRVVWRLGEWLPTSGGTGAVDLFARSGIGDGPEEIAGDNARAAGMVETDKMIEDNKNALIDLVNDMYGPPHRPPQEQERMVAGGKADIISFHGKLPENRRPSRDFDTSRKGPSQRDKKLESLRARALFEVEGQTPLHVRVVVYESYDGVNARWLEGRKPSLRFLEATGGDWMRVSHIRETAGWYWEKERHRFKVAELKTNLVPTPALLTAFRINKVDRPDYYDWDYEGVLVLAGRKTTPPGVVITTECQTLDYCRLPSHAFLQSARGDAMAPLLVRVPESIRPALQAIAEEWAGDQPAGWPQIEAILKRLRQDFTLDWTVAVPADHPAPVMWFLTESYRGPDYLFASAATLLLRCMGYPTRLCLGYYADPQAYDPATAHTPVRAADLHFWPEVLLRDGQWLVLEPTPGYDVLGPRLPWSERLRLAWLTVWDWSRRNTWLLATVAFSSAAVIARRRSIIDTLAVWRWLWFPKRSWQKVVLECLRLLERRCRWAGCGRLPHQTLSAWGTRLCRSTPGDVSLLTLVRLSEWAAYASGLPPPIPPDQIQATCRQTLRSWTLRHLQRLSRETSYQ